MLTSSDYNGKLISSEMCARMTEIQTRNRVPQIEMSACTIFSALENEVEEMNTFYMKNTGELLNEQLKLAKLHQIHTETIYRASRKGC